MNASRSPSSSPLALARTTGALYLLTVLTGLFAQGFVSGRLVVSGDAAATAANILTHRGLFELGFAVYLVEMACNVAITSLFYELLLPVNRRVALLSALLGLVGCAIETFSRVFYIAPLFLLDGGHASSAFGPAQLQSLALLSLQVNEQGAGMALAFFGFHGLLKGYLIFRSTFLPRIFGVVSAVAGLGLLTFLSPTLGVRLFPAVAAVGLAGALAMILWLLVVGVNAPRWEAQARVGTEGLAV
ncbi:DUF4386 domain-containing protein [Aggregicoccus sp. 17bor-14]|uniref:DUF4386 domain-containing protein n=1 Tax=Myxococcaceae TaxID=31 RepID=UPI00129C74B7|nr:MULTISPECIES: DUF4386 domain-containing protein [Myxococcaceae]MBF5045868.1 DUF4386 domain-containing protein [Simulacricoccus sp. 17bor-14]MRI91602.1 DUF4386 domain-containing protein [Aggregicoccus sp. 17bor-14]